MSIAPEDKIVAFVASPDEADAYIGQYPPNGDLSRSPKVIALTPAAQAHLKRRGYDAESTLPYLTPTSRERALQRSAELTRWVREHFDFEDSLGVRDGYVENLVWYTRWLTNYLLCSLEILENTVASHDPDTLWVCVPESSNVEGPFVSDKEQYFSTVAGNFAASRGIELRSISVHNQTSLRERVNRAGNQLVAMLASNPLVARLHLRQIRRLENQGAVLFTSRNYRMNVLAGRIGQEQKVSPVLSSNWGSRRPIGWPLAMNAIQPFAAEAMLSLLEPLAHEDKDSRRRLEGVIDGFARGVSQTTDVFSHLGVSFADLAKRKALYGIKPVILRLHRRAATLHTFLHTMRPSLVFSNGSRSDDMITGELCKMARIPAMMITHGSHTPPSNDAERYEWGEHGRRLINAPYGFTALQSPLAEKFHQAFPADSKGMRTGPLIWATAGNVERSAALRDRMLGDAAEDRVIVHAGTAKRQNVMRFHVYETFDEYVQGIRDLIDAVEQVPKARLIIKFRPSPELTLEDLKTLVPFSEKAMISVEEPLLDVLGFTDLLVSFSSTVIEEALRNRVPVLLYGGDGRYQHISAPSVATGDNPGPSAVYHVKERSHLSYALQYILDTCDKHHLGDDLFTHDVYRPEQIISITELLNAMKESADAPAVRQSHPTHPRRA